MVEQKQQPYLFCASKVGSGHEVLLLLRTVVTFLQSWAEAGLAPPPALPDPPAVPSISGSAQWRALQEHIAFSWRIDHHWGWSSNVVRDQHGFQFVLVCVLAHSYNFQFCPFNLLCIHVPFPITCPEDLIPWDQTQKQWPHIDCETSSCNCIKSSRINT